MTFNMATPSVESMNSNLNKLGVNPISDKSVIDPSKILLSYNGLCTPSSILIWQSIE